MKTAQQWWAETADDEAWLDDQASIIERIQRDAFRAGAVAQRDETVRLASQVALQLPQVIVHADVAITIAKAADPEHVVARRFGQPEPAAAATAAPSADDENVPRDAWCERCQGTGSVEDVDEFVIDCPTCAGSGRQ